MINLDNKPCIFFEMNPLAVQLFPGKGLPQDIEHYIFSLLNHSDLPGTARVSKSSNVFIIYNFKQNELFYFNKFNIFVNDNVKNNLITTIYTLGKARLQNDFNLNDLTSTIRKLKSEVINELKGLGKDEILKFNKQFKALKNSHFFTNIFYLAALYRQMDMLETLPPSHLRDKEHLKLSMQLFRNDDSSTKAIEAANKISNESTKIKLLAIIQNESSELSTPAEVECEIPAKTEEIKPELTTSTEVEYEIPSKIEEIKPVKKNKDHQKRNNCIIC